MKYIHLSGDVDKEMLNQLYAELEGYEGPIEVSLSSGGGKTPIAERILELLNERTEACELIVLDHAFSAAFDIFIGFKGRKRVLTGAVGMLHQPSVDELYFYGEGKPSALTSAVLSLLKHTEYKYREIAKEVLTKAEYRSYLNGDEVYLEYPRMKKLCNFFVEMVA